MNYVIYLRMNKELKLNIEKYVRTWLSRGRRSATDTCYMTRREDTEENYFAPIWKYL
jgi:hypothetical protein